MTELLHAPWLRPVGLLGGAAAARAVDAGLGRPLAGGPLAFTAIECIEPERRRALGLGAVPGQWEARLDALSRPRPPFAGLPLDRPLIMGILNVTPDSFSDGGRHRSVEAAVDAGAKLLEAGAELLDVGGESTRPGATSVPAEEQIRRVEPVIRALSQRGAAVSVDTRDPSVMAAALAAGARIVNDVSALAAPGAIQAVAAAGAAAILVHMQGEPGTMQREPRYGDVVREVAEHLEGRLAACLAAGIPLHRLAVDPGIGFGKRSAHNAALLDEVAVLHGLGVPIVLGASRKGWVGALETWAPAERLGGSIVAATAGLDRGVQILRVHDVAQTHQARLAWSALNHAR